MSGMTAVYGYSPAIDPMTRQTLPRDVAAGAFPATVCDDAHQHHHFQPANNNIVSPLSLPAPVRNAFPSSLSPVPVPNAHATQSLSAVAAAQRPASSHSHSVQPAAAGFRAVPGSYTQPSARRQGGPKFRSVSASPATRTRYGSTHHGPHPAVATIARPSVMSPPSSTGNRSSSASDRTRLLAVEAEKISWEAEKAGFKRHIEVLEEKLREAMIENEELRERLDAVISGDCGAEDDLPLLEEEPDTTMLQRAEEEEETAEPTNALSPVVSRGRAPPSASTFVPLDKIPGTASTNSTITAAATNLVPTSSSREKAVVEAHVDTMTSPGGTRTSEAVVSATVTHSETVTQPPPQSWPQVPPPSTSLDPTETMDVSTIDPELEGIRIKASAIQRPTFALSQASPPPESNDPPLAGAVAGPGSGSNPGSKDESPSKADLDFTVRKSSKAQTLHVLATAEAGRRRMHAGHTPSHSVSHFPIPVAAEVTEAALGAAREAAQELADREAGEAPDAAEHDQPLRGHLIAQSDGTPSVFIDEFTKKLEDISRGTEDAVPSVLKNPTVPLDEVVEVIEAEIIRDAEEPEVAGEIEIDTEPEVPLKLKSTTNFGLPWGQLGRKRTTSSDLYAINS